MIICYTKLWFNQGTVLTLQSLGMQEYFDLKSEKCKLMQAFWQQTIFNARRDNKYSEINLYFECRWHHKYIYVEIIWYASVTFMKRPAFCETIRFSVLSSHFFLFDLMNWLNIILEWTH